MGSFFEKMQRGMRVADDGTVPGYLRTHPVTTERIADAQNRAASLPYKQHLDSPEFQLVRAKLRAEAGDARDAVEYFQSAVREKRYASESAARYGLAAALLRARRAKEADAELARARAAGASGPMIETLAARVKLALGDRAGAASLLGEAHAPIHVRARCSTRMPRRCRKPAAMPTARRCSPSRCACTRAIRACTNCRRRTTPRSASACSQHQSQAEVYALQGSLPAAIEQLQIARAAGDGDFYQLSVVDARLKELRAQHAQELRDRDGKR